MARNASAGLYHAAILFESEAALAAALHSVFTRAPGTFTGSADHLVSKAFYFTDPEGNGVELYWDRDRAEWSWTHGQLEIVLPTPDDVGQVGERLTHYGHQTENDGRSLVVADPWDNRIRVTTAL